MSKKIAVLGAGPSGISAGYHLMQQGLDVTVYEKKEDYGGLCGGFYVGDYHFDVFAHMTFSKNPIVNALLEDRTPHSIHMPEAYNYYQGSWVRNPVQNNLIGLDVSERIQVIEDFINRPVDKQINNYEDWLLVSYGDYFAKHFPTKYTRKYWTVEPAQLETKWVQNRMYTPQLSEVLRGAMTEETPNVHYSKEMHYPLQGGFQGFLKSLADEIDICCNKEVVKIDAQKKNIFFADGTMETYDSVVSTLPLTEYPKLMEDMPEDIAEATEALDYTSGYIISIGLDCKVDFPSVWFYIYDEDIWPARIHFPDKESDFNAPDGCSSLQAEVYVSKYKQLKCSEEELKEKVINQLLRLNLFQRENIVVTDVRFEKYANIMFTPAIYEARQMVRKYLENKDIITAGRFGEWDYLWLEQSLLSGKRAAEDVLRDING